MQCWVLMWRWCSAAVETRHWKCGNKKFWQSLNGLTNEPEEAVQPSLLCRSIPNTSSWITTVCTRKVICGVTDALRFICIANTVKCRYCYYFKLYNITTLVAKCRIDSFRLRGTGSMCHMFLLNVEFSNACRFRIFQCHFSTVTRFPFSRFQLPQCWHAQTE